MKIYTLFTCDEWKSNDSMRLAFIGTSKQKLRKCVINMIENKNMEYNNPNAPIRQQIKDFKIDFDNNNMRLVNSSLQYGMIGIYENNETL